MTVSISSGSKLDFSGSGHIAERLGETLHEGAREFNDLIDTSGCLETLVPPQRAPDERQGVGEGGALLAVPRGPARGSGRIGHVLVGEEGDERAEAEQRRRGAADRQVGPV